MRVKQNVNLFVIISNVFLRRCNQLRPLQNTAGTRVPPPSVAGNGTSALPECRSLTTASRLSCGRRTVEAAAPHPAAVAFATVFHWTAACAADVMPLGVDQRAAHETKEEIAVLRLHEPKDAALRLVAPVHERLERLGGDFIPQLLADRHAQTLLPPASVSRSSGRFQL